MLDTRLVRALKTATNYVRAYGREVTGTDLLQALRQTPVGSMTEGERIDLEAHATWYLWGACLALGNRGFTGFAEGLRDTYLRETAEGPLEAFAYEARGYGAVAMDLRVIWSVMTNPADSHLQSYLLHLLYLWDHLSHQESTGDRLGRRLDGLDSLTFALTFGDP